MTSAERMFTSRRIALTPGVRATVELRCGAACESCGLAWPWALDLFRVSEDGPNTAANLVALCPRCSEDRVGPCTPLVAHHGLRERMRFANNRRAAVHPLTPARRRALIASRGGCCEICGISGSLRTLEVHHMLAVLQGGHDGEDNLQVLCFACHRQVQPCLTGCGAWAKKPRQLCRHCLTRKRLEDLMPEATWEEIKARYPSFVAQWKPGYEPNALPPPNDDHQASADSDGGASSRAVGARPGGLMPTTSNTGSTAVEPPSATSSLSAGGAIGPSMDVDGGWFGMPAAR